jgi:hypothetical protein
MCRTISSVSFLDRVCGLYGPRLTPGFDPRAMALIMADPHCGVNNEL